MQVFITIFYSENRRRLGIIFDEPDFAMAEPPIAIESGGLPAVGQFGQV